MEKILFKMFPKDVEKRLGMTIEDLASTASDYSGGNVGTSRISSRRRTAQKRNHQDKEEVYCKSHDTLMSKAIWWIPIWRRFGFFYHLSDHR